MALIYFAVTLFVSAFLLFLVQPMIGKMILPRLGGTPQVWNTCMMFFQTVLLCGYFYTHYVTKKLPLRKQLLTHCLVLLLPLPVLLAFGRPFYVAGFGAEGGGNPIFVTLLLLTVIVGLPFLVVSTTAPLLQSWFHNTGHPSAKDPYFLYGASNLGSILGLVLYPVTVEYFLGLDEQAWFWLGGYVALVGLVGGCAFMVKKAPASVQLPNAPGEVEIPPPPSPETPVAPPPEETAVTATPPSPAARATGIKRGGKQRGGRGGRGPLLPAAEKGPTINIKKTNVEHHHVEDDKPFEMTPLRRIRWIGLAAVPASLMLGCTTYISTDISPIPLLWIIPLTLYLLSFVLVFLRWPVPWVGTSRTSIGTTPHKAMLVAQLVGIPLLMLVFMTGGYSAPLRAMIICWGAFFLTALVCHGELARDRPPAKHLTEFYLCMSLGGMLGGTFNALFAPLIPWFGLFEFPMAIVFAALVRPGQKGESWTDSLLGAYQSPSGESISTVLDFMLPLLVLGLSYFLISHSLDPNSWGLSTQGLANPGDYSKDVQAKVAEENLDHPLFKIAYKTIGLGGSTSYYFAATMFLLITYGIGMACALLGWKRPVRMALGLGAVLLASAIFERFHDDRVLYRDRSYFGILRVLEDKRQYKSPDGKERITFAQSTSLLHGTTLHGLNYKIPDGTTGIPDNSGTMKMLPDLRRLATTYYHREGPVGVVMERLNWFPGLKYDNDVNGKPLPSPRDDRVTYWADARLPVSVIGACMPSMGVSFPLAPIISAWSEPAYATIGLGTGTMASYSRPFQHMTFYEIDECIRNFSLPPPGRDTYFSYLQGAIKRGTKLEVIMGDARLTMTKEKANENGTLYLPKYKFGKEANEFAQWEGYTSYEKRQSYYRAIEVDAFSSDAIPVHLITKEAIEMYMDKLMPNGVLLVHTSNRHVNLVRPVLKICEIAQWKDWGAYEQIDDPDNPGKKKNDLSRPIRDANGDPLVKTGLAWVVCKDDDKERGFNIENPSRNGHSGSEYVLVARKQEYLPPYAWTPEQIKTYETLGVHFMTDNITIKQFNEINDQRVAAKKSKLNSIKSTITFLNPGNAQANQATIDYYGYYVPPGTRAWTDDYSNVLSVFRWR